MIPNFYFVFFIGNDHEFDVIYGEFVYSHPIINVVVNDILH